MVRPKHAMVRQMTGADRVTRSERKRINALKRQRAAEAKQRRTSDRPE